MSSDEHEDIRRIYDKLSQQGDDVHELSSKINLFIATQTIESKAQADRLDKLESSNERINQNFDKIKTWLLAGSLLVGSLVFIGKGVFWIYEHGNEIAEFLRNGK